MNAEENARTLLPPALICRTLTPASAAGTSRLPRPPAPHLPPALIKPSKVARTLDGAIRRPQQRATRPAGRSTLPPCEPVAPGLLVPLLVHHPSKQTPVASKELLPRCRHLTHARSPCLRHPGETLLHAAAFAGAADLLAMLIEAGARVARRGRA